MIALIQPEPGTLLHFALRLCPKHHKPFPCGKCRIESAQKPAQAPPKVGRPAQNEVAMTPAERKRKQRAGEKVQQVLDGNKDSKGTLPGESSGGYGYQKIETVADQAWFQEEGPDGVARATKPTGNKPDGDGGFGGPLDTVFGRPRNEAHKREDKRLTKIEDAIAQAAADACCQRNGNNVCQYCGEHLPESEMFEHCKKRFHLGEEACRTWRDAFDKYGPEDPRTVLWRDKYQELQAHHWAILRRIS